MAKRKIMDRGYVDIIDKLSVFYDTKQKVMYVDTSEYADVKGASIAYRKAIQRIRWTHMMRVITSRNELFLVRTDL